MMRIMNSRGSYLCQTKIECCNFLYNLKKHVKQMDEFIYSENIILTLKNSCKDRVKTVQIKANHTLKLWNEGELEQNNQEKNQNKNDLKISQSQNNLSNLSSKSPFKSKLSMLRNLSKLKKSSNVSPEMRKQEIYDKGMDSLLKTQSFMRSKDNSALTKYDIKTGSKSKEKVNSHRQPFSQTFNSKFRQNQLNRSNKLDDSNIKVLFKNKFNKEEQKVTVLEPVKQIELNDPKEINIEKDNEVEGNKIIKETKYSKKELSEKINESLMTEDKLPSLNNKKEILESKSNYESEISESRNKEDTVTENKVLDADQRNLFNEEEINEGDQLLPEMPADNMSSKDLKDEVHETEELNQEQDIANIECTEDNLENADDLDQQDKFNPILLSSENNNEEDLLVKDSIDYPIVKQDKKLKKKIKNKKDEAIITSNKKDEAIITSNKKVHTPIKKIKKKKVNDLTIEQEILFSIISKATKKSSIKFNPNIINCSGLLEEMKKFDLLVNEKMSNINDKVNKIQNGILGVIDNINKKETKQEDKPMVYSDIHTVENIQHNKNEDLLLIGDEKEIKTESQDDTLINSTDKINIDPNKFLLDTDDNTNPLTTWQKIINDLEFSGDLNIAYKEVLQIKDDILLLRLLFLTSPCLNELDSEISKSTILHLIKIYKCHRLEKEINSLIEQSIDLNLFVHFSNEEKNEVLDFLFLNSSWENPQSNFSHFLYKSILINN